MAKITPEMEVLLKYAEQKRLCLYLLPNDALSRGNAPDPDFKSWEDCLWEPHELREAIIDSPGQSRAGKTYPTYRYPFDINTTAIWRIVDPQDLLFRYETNADATLREGHALKKMAAHFKAVWIDHTERRPDVLIGKLQSDIEDRLTELAVKGIT